MTWDAEKGRFGPPLALPEIVLHLAPRAKLRWPAEVLSRDGDAVTIRLFDKGIGHILCLSLFWTIVSLSCTLSFSGTTEKVVPSNSLTPFAEAPSNLKSSDLRKAYRLAQAKIDRSIL